MRELTLISLSPYLDGCLLPWLFRRNFFSSAWHFSKLSPLLLCSIWYFFKAACRGQRRVSQCRGLAGEKHGKEDLKQMNFVCLSTHVHRNILFSAMFGNKRASHSPKIWSHQKTNLKYEIFERNRAVILLLIVDHIHYPPTQSDAVIPTICHRKRTCQLIIVIFWRNEAFSQNDS